MRRAHRDRRWLGAGKTAAQVVLLAVILGGLLWFAATASGRRDANDAAICARHYREARSGSDTARVDALWPSGRDTKQRNSAATLRCGALRAAGRVPI